MCLHCCRFKLIIFNGMCTCISGVVVVSWYPAGDADNEGLEPDSLMPLILDKAHKYDLKVILNQQLAPF